MSVPGSNLLNKAFGAIAKQTVAWYQFTGRAPNDAGNLVSTYAAPVNITGSLQPVTQSKYAFLGLDFKKVYVNFFCPKTLLSLQRDVSGDMFTYNGKTYQIESLTDWFAQDGWVEAMAVMVHEPLPPGVTP